MSVGEPVEQLEVDLHKSHSISEFGVWYAQRGIWLRPCVFSDGHGERFERGVYLVSVLSANDLATEHCVLLDCRGSRRAVFDPNRDRPDKRSYFAIDETDALGFYELVD